MPLDPCQYKIGKPLKLGNYANAINGNVVIETLEIAFTDEWIMNSATNTLFGRLAYSENTPVSTNHL